MEYKDSLSIEEYLQSMSEVWPDNIPQLYNVKTIATLRDVGMV